MLGWPNLSFNLDFIHMYFDLIFNSSLLMNFDFSLISIFQFSQRLWIAQNKNLFSQEKECPKIRNAWFVFFKHGQSVFDDLMNREEKEWLLENHWRWILLFLCLLMHWFSSSQLGAKFWCGCDKTNLPHWPKNVLELSKKVTLANRIVLILITPPSSN